MGGSKSKLHRDVLENIPPEIVNIIFHLLSPLDIANARLVCTDWNYFISGTPTLLKKIRYEVLHPTNSSDWNHIKIHTPKKLVSRYFHPDSCET